MTHQAPPHRPRLPRSIRTDRTNSVYSCEREIGRIYQTCSGPDSLRCFWSLTVNGPMTRSDRVATLEEAKAEFQKSWDAWKAWAKLKRSIMAINRRTLTTGPLQLDRTELERGWVTCG